MAHSTKNPFAPLYRIKTCTWPTLQRDQRIPDQLASTHHTPGKPSMVGPGVVNAFVALLTDQRVISLGVASDRWTIALTSQSTPGTVHHLGGSRSIWYVEHISYLVAVCGITGMLTIHRQEARTQVVVQSYAEFLARLRATLGTAPPYTLAQMQHAARVQSVTDALMTCCDESYFLAKEYGQSHLQQLLEQADPTPVPPTPGAIELYLYQAPLAPGATSIPSVAPPPVRVSQRTVSASPTNGTASFAPSTPPPPPSLDAIIRRLVARGGTGLLFGPTSGGKSTTVRRAVVEAQARLVVVRGRPSLDDRQLYGGITSTDGGYRWVDGPLSEIWRLAGSGQRSVLLIDELLRFDPYYLNALVGALDRIRGDELVTMPRISEVVARDIQPQRWYYVLDVPNGDRLVAPAELLSIIATCNYGADYIQANQIDSALLNRFQVRVPVSRLERDRQMDILAELGIAASITRVLVAMGEFSITQCGDTGGLLQREITLRTLQDWATEAMALVMAEGLSWGTALLQAADYTIIPYACPWVESGQVEDAPAQVLREQLAVELRRHKVA